MTANSKPKILSRWADITHKTCTALLCTALLAVLCAAAIPVGSNHDYKGLFGPTNCKAPTASSDAATKGYVDALATAKTVTFSSDGAILAASGVSAVSRVSAGTYDITRSAASNANYAVTATAEVDADDCSIGSSSWYVTTANQIDALSATSTFSIFARLRQTNLTGNLFSQYVSSSAVVWFGTSSSQLRCYCGSSSSYGALNLTELGWREKEWFSVAAVFDGTQAATNSLRLKLYYNGTKYSVSSFTGSIPAVLPTINQPARLHSAALTGSYSGYLHDTADFAVFSNVLTDAEIADLHAGTYPTAAPVFRVPFTAGSNADSTSNETVTLGGSNPTYGARSGYGLVARPVAASQTTTVVRIEFRDPINGTLTDPTRAHVTLCP